MSKSKSKSCALKRSFSPIDDAGAGAFDFEGSDADPPTVG